jgi:hypothetical protein
MKRVAVIAYIALCYSNFALAASVPATPEAQVAQLEQKTLKSAASPTGEYAKDLLDAVKSTIAEAKTSLAAGKEKVAFRQLEIAAILLIEADAKAAERELLEKVAVRRSELKKMEARLERYRQGEEN